MGQPGHQALFYESDQERLAYLVTYFGMGLHNNELCVWVTDCPQSEAAQILETAGLIGATQYAANNQLRIFDAKNSYLQNNEFTSQYMLANVYGFLEDAHKDGFSGLRTAGEMNWLHDHPEAHEEATSYEAVVNTISGSVPFTGLCLYKTEQTSVDTLRGVLNTHPFIARNSTSIPNPLFVSPV